MFKTFKDTFKSARDLVEVYAKESVEEAKEFIAEEAEVTKEMLRTDVKQAVRDVRFVAEDVQQLAAINLVRVLTSITNVVRRLLVR